MLLLAGDQFDETVDEGAVLVAITKRLGESALELQLRRTDFDVLELVLANDLDVGLDDEELVVPCRVRFGDDHVVRLELLDQIVLHRSGRVTNDFGAEVSTGLVVSARDQNLLRDGKLLRNTLREHGAGLHGGVRGEVHTNRTAAGDLAEREEQDVGGGTVAAASLLQFRVVAVKFGGRIDCASLGVDQLLSAVRNARFAIGEEHRVHDVEPVVRLELGNHQHGADDCFVKGSAAEIPPRRAIHVPGRVRNTGQGASELAHLNVLLLVHARGEQVQQREHIVRRRLSSRAATVLRGGVLIPIKTDTILTPHAEHIVLIGARISSVFGSSAPRTSRERIDFERNPCATAEVAEHIRLLKHGQQIAGHGTRPVNVHDEAVILSLRQNRVAAEDVIRPLVARHANRVKDAGVANRGALRHLSSLSQFKLLDQQVDATLALANKLLVGRENVLAVLLIIRLHRVEETRRIGLGVSHERLVVDHDLGEIGENQFGLRDEIRGFVSIGLLHALLKRVVERLLSDGRRSSASSSRRGRRRLRLGAFLLLVTIGRTLSSRSLILLIRRIRLVAATLHVLRRTLVLRLLALLALGRLRVVLPVVRRVAVVRNGRRLLLLLLLRLLLLAEGVEIRSDGRDLIERLCSVDTRDELLLVSGETNTDRTDGAELVVQVQAIRERERVEVDLLHAEEVLGGEFVVRSHEVALEAGELVLDQPFDTRILNHVEVERRSAPLRRGSVGRTADRIASRTPAVSGSVQRVGDLMPDEHVVHVAAHVLPLGKIQNAIREIERCGARSRIHDDRDVLGRQNARHDGRGRVIVRGGSDGGKLSHSVHYTGPGGSCQPPKTYLENGGTSDNCTINNRQMIRGRSL